MRCRCGNEIQHVPEHLQGLANWVCQQCTNKAPRSGVAPTTSDEPIRKQVTQGRSKKAA